MTPWPDILDTRDPDVAYRYLTGCYVGVDNYDVVGKASEFRLNRYKMELGRLIIVRGKLRTGYRLRALPGSHRQREERHRLAARPVLGRVSWRKRLHPARLA